MSISSISGTSSLANLAAQQARSQTQQPQQAVEQQQGPGFGERVRGALNQVAEAQNHASDVARAYETGDTNDLAAVMVEQQVASLGFQMTMSVRNKALTAYRDIMNMPV